MTIREFIQQEIDIDVYDDVCEELSIAFCGPQPLTPEGEKEFADIMDFEVEINPHSYGDMAAAIIHIDDPDEKVWEKRLKQVRKFFEGAAGYCPVTNYNKWFGEEGDGK